MNKKEDPEYLDPEKDLASFDPLKTALAEGHILGRSIKGNYPKTWVTKIGFTIIGMFFLMPGIFAGAFFLSASLAPAYLFVGITMALTFSSPGILMIWKAWAPPKNKEAEKKANPALNEDRAILAKKKGISVLICPGCKNKNNPAFTNCWKCQKELPL